MLTAGNGDRIWKTYHSIDLLCRAGRNARPHLAIVLGARTLAGCPLPQWWKRASVARIPHTRLELEDHPYYRSRLESAQPAILKLSP